MNSSRRPIYNLNPGPAILPREVLEEASRGVLEIAGSGMSILEVSHRGPEYEPIHAQAQEDLLALMGLSRDEYAVLFLWGGASLQFAMIPMNFLPENRSADYVNTGEWATRAIVEARRFGTVDVVASSEDKHFTYLPRAIPFNQDSVYAHISSNNTIFGTGFDVLPDSGELPLFCDMSSDFLSRRRDFDRLSLIYAGAQKNAGADGVTLVVIRKDLVSRARAEIPTVLDYRTHLKNNSLYNTPPVFGIYLVGLVAKWLRAQGGLDAVERVNRLKKDTLYEALDSIPDIYRPTVAEHADRSWMNVTFRLRNEGMEQRFLSEAESAGFRGLKGHRSVGGCRASLYNAFPQEGVDALVTFMRAFARRNS